ncbi:MAG: 4-(cytidine 5'-diphospho)-2-C-methyl-D-erythritol kinase [Candidatus Eisenbacteria bacterium]
MKGEARRFSAFAKVNLSLHVLGKRPDGYHDISSLMMTVDLADRLAVRRLPSEIVLECDSPEVPPGVENLCVRAALRLKEKCRVREGAEITLEKAIPVAAGLGGGSSDAACTLVGLNALWGLGLTDQELEGIASDIGSDVPFFVRGGAQIAQGRGERLTPVGDFPELWLVIVVPPLKVSSAWAYSVAPAGVGKMRLTTPEHENRMIPLTVRVDAAGVSRSLWNDLEGGVIQKHPAVRELKDALVHLGALGSLMSGSGPSVFGVARDRFSAIAIASSMSRPGLSVFSVRSSSKGWVEAGHI